MSCKISLMVSVDIKHNVYLLMTFSRVHEICDSCESRGGRSGLPVPNISNINNIQDYFIISPVK